MRTVRTNNRVTVSVGFTDGSGGGKTGQVTSVDHDSIEVTDETTGQTYALHLDELKENPFYNGVSIIVHHENGSWENAELPKVVKDDDALFSVEEVDDTARFISHPAWKHFGDNIIKEI